MSFDSGGVAREPVVSPRIRKVGCSDLNLAVIQDDELQTRVVEALSSMPLKDNSEDAFKPVLRRVFLGPGGVPFNAGNAMFRATKHLKDGTEGVYASAVRKWSASCASQGTDPLAMDRSALEEYRDDVRIEEDGISAGTWNNNLAALRWFADTAVSEGLMDAMAEWEWKSLRLHDESVRWLKVVDADTYLTFVYVGLQGLDPRTMGIGPKSFSIRTPVRDTLFADFLVTHGVRRAEACHLTLLDLPARRPDRSTNLGWLPSNICKWGSGRDLEEKRLWANRLSRYHNTEWSSTVEGAQKMLRSLDKSKTLLVVTEVRHRFDRDTKVTIRGRGPRSLINLSKEDRRRLVCTPEVAREIGREAGMGDALQRVPDSWLVPLAIFPGTKAPMLAPEAWSGTFREANERVEQAFRAQGREPPNRVTPHMLRHTFATRFLSDELERMAESDRENIETASMTDTAMLKRRYFNPLIRVKNILGHKSLDTTLLYINYVMQESSSNAPLGGSWIESFLGGRS